MKNLTPAQRNDTCASCHAKSVRVAEGFQPGSRFADHYSLVALESDDYYPDGRDKRENYTLTSWTMSACVRSGKLDCMHCHTSTGQYKFSAEKEANNACLPCHAERVKNAAAHSHHAEGTAGSRCVSCHMPATEYARMKRSDHSTRPPAPAATLAYGSPNACNGCHVDKSASWADRQARQWFPRDYQAPILARAALIDAARKRDWSKLSAMLAAISKEPDEVFRASLIRLLAECRDERRFPTLIHALQDSSPMVRASAVDALADSVRPETIGPLTAAARDSFRTVRIRAGAALAGLDQSAAVDRAIGEYVKSMRSYPDDYAQRMNLGVFQADRRQFDQALAEYAQAMRLRPAAAPPLVNAALVYNQLGRNAEAESSLRKAIAIDPASAAPHLNLGLLLAEMGRNRDAEAALRRSIELDKTNPVAAYNLAVIVGKERPAEAAKWLRIAVEDAPAEPKYSYTLAYFLSKAGDAAQAISVLEQARARHAIDANGADLLNELHRGRR